MSDNQRTASSDDLKIVLPVFVAIFLLGVLGFNLAG